MCTLTLSSILFQVCIRIVSYLAFKISSFVSFFSFCGERKEWICWLFFFSPRKKSALRIDCYYFNQKQCFENTGDAIILDYVYLLAAKKIGIENRLLLFQPKQCFENTGDAIILDYFYSFAAK